MSAFWLTRAMPSVKKVCFTLKYHLGRYARWTGVVAIWGRGLFPRDDPVSYLEMGAPFPTPPQNFGFILFYLEMTP